MMRVRSNTYSSSSRDKSFNCKKCFTGWPDMMRYRFLRLQKRFNERTQSVHQLLSFGLGHNQWWQQTYHIVGGDVDEQTVCQCLFDQIATGFIQLDTQHQTLTAYLDH